jgi:hypothetical protein
MKASGHLQPLKEIESELSDGLTSPTAGGRYKVPHTVNLLFVFDNIAIAPGLVGNIPEDHARAQRMADAVSESYLVFARTGNPITIRSRLTSIRFQGQVPR